MKKIWEFYETMNEIVTVSDIDSYEIVYMNRKARDVYRIPSVDEVKGQLCYEVLQGCSQTCAICNNKKLRTGEFDEWTYYNSYLDKNFIIKDTLIEEDGKRYRMEIAIDAGSRNTETEVVQEYIDSEFIINESLRISLSADRADDSIAAILEYLGKSLKCERAYIFEGTIGKEYDNTYEWCAKGVVPQKDNLQGLAFDVVKIWIERFQTNSNVIIQDIEDIKESDPAMYDCLKPQDIHSLVTSPLIDNDTIIGFYGVDNPPGEMLNHISTLFQIMGHFIVLLLRRCELFKRLEGLSFYDQLTGFGNRHAVEEYVAHMQPENSIGVVYCDVMGLKKVNDALGHKAGDELLLRACKSLRTAFSEYHLFRIGGDEFLVMCSGITEEELQKNIQILQTEMKQDSAEMAIGSVWYPQSIEDIDVLLAEADRIMYEDKRRYYAAKRKS